ncbi:MAG TPA: RNA polymerase sigma factor [Sedimentisphaerales bacterium]|nr:RNA polymerase sigma factor [Sedimentisphaerales bacterium]
MDSVLERKLVALCRNGDKSACGELVKAYSARVFALSLGILGNTHDAEDITQQALLKALTDMNQLRDGQRFGPWLCQITRNLCIDLVRKRRRGSEALLRVAPSDKGRGDGVGELETALAGLPDDYRIALLLYYFDGKTGRSIAETLQISEMAVNARLSRARKKLRELLEAEGDI